MIRLINCSTDKIHNVIPDLFLSDPSDNAVSRPHNLPYNKIKQMLTWCHVTWLKLLFKFRISTSLELLCWAQLTHGSSLTNEEAYFYKIPYSSLILFCLLLLCYFFFPICSAVFKLGMPNEEESGTVGYQWACGSTGSHSQVYLGVWTFTHLCGLRIIFEWLHGDYVHMLFMQDPSEYRVTVLVVNLWHYWPHCRHAFK